MTHLRISVPAITRGTLARTHELKKKLATQATAALLDTRKAVERPLAPTGQKKSVAVLRCFSGFY